jgi:glycosyltransferase involved in cell wall biosynthesis
MLKAKPAVLASVSHDARELSDCGSQRKPAAAPIRVLLIAPTLDIIGGQSMQANQLVRCMAKEPSVEMRFLPVNPRIPRALSMKYVRTLITLAVYLARLLVEIPRADILHIFTPGYLAFYLAPVPALALARLFGKRAILNYHDGRAEDHLARWPLARRLMRLAAVIVVPSRYLVRIFRRFGIWEKCISNVAETEPAPYRARLHPRPVFLHNRGLAPEYNPACTLRAFAIIQKRYPDARLVVAHDGPLRGALEALAESLGLRQTQFVGSVSAERMSVLYDSADVYLMSPNADNMPLSVLECFASGLPVVASRVGGVPDLVEDGTSGLLFEPDDHAAMAAGALRLIEQPGLAAQLAANARAQWEQYGWSRVGPQWIALYERLLDRSISSV